tara:strand:+ start:31747 stop:32103 length:357 start_codon:yes stop_codon:yes gene_type:complete
MMRLLHTVLGYSLFAAITVVMLALPFVHRAGAEPVSPDIARFIAIGGDLLDICGESSHHRASGCESCTIAATLLMPSCGGPLRPILVLASLAPEATGIGCAPRSMVKSTPPVRAPPRA